MVTSTPLPAKQKTSWTSYVAAGFAGLFGLAMVFIVGLVVFAHIKDSNAAAKKYAAQRAADVASGADAALHARVCAHMRAAGQVVGPDCAGL